MREILFRGKRVDNDKWIYGPQFYLGTNWEVPNAIVNWRKNGTYEAVDVIPETVGQYTGLTDKNGIKIFEGDVCLYDDYIGYIEWDENDSMFTFIYDENICINFSHLFGRELEVIGNIHDNPELLESEALINV